MNKGIRFIIVLTVGLCGLWLSSCVSRIPEQTEIVILSTTDLHGRFDHLAKFSALVKQTKAEHKNVIVVDAGDRFTGNPYNDLYERRQFPIVDLMNLIGYDVMLIGNHEFDFGIELLNERVKETKASVIMANIRLKGSGLRNVKPYRIVRKNGIKVAFLGLSNVDKETGKPSIVDKRVAGIDYYDPIETALKFRHLRRKAHVFVALTHIGLLEDLILADSMPELDLIIGGHSHLVFNEPVIQNNVIIAHPGYYAKNVVKTTILLKRGVVSKITNEFISLTTWDGPTDPVIEERISMYEGDLFFETPFASLEHEIPNVEQLSYMMTDAAITLPGVNFSVLNHSGIRLYNLSEGPVTLGDILRLSPFNNYLIIVGLKAESIRDFIQKRRDFVAPAGFVYTARRGSDGFPIVEEMTFPCGGALDETKTYFLAVDNFLFSKYFQDYTDYATNTGIFVVDNVMNFLISNPNVDYRNRPVRAKPVE